LDFAVVLCICLLCLLLVLFYENMSSPLGYKEEPRAAASWKKRKVGAEMESKTMCLMRHSPVLITTYLALVVSKYLVLHELLCQYIKSQHHLS